MISQLTDKEIIAFEICLDCRCDHDGELARGVDQQRGGQVSSLDKGGSGGDHDVSDRRVGRLD